MLAQQLDNAAQKHAPHLVQVLIQLVCKTGNGTGYVASSVLCCRHSVAVPTILSLAGVACDLQQSGRQCSLELLTELI